MHGEEDGDKGDVHDQVRHGMKLIKSISMHNDAIVFSLSSDEEGDIQGDFL